MIFNIFYLIWKAVVYLGKISEETFFLSGWKMRIILFLSVILTINGHGPPLTRVFIISWFFTKHATAKELQQFLIIYAPSLSKIFLVLCVYKAFLILSLDYRLKSLVISKIIIEYWAKINILLCWLCIFFNCVVSLVLRWPFLNHRYQVWTCGNYFLVWRSSSFKRHCTAFDRFLLVHESKIKMIGFS